MNINRFIRTMLVISGFIFLFLGILGILLPLLPTTPFVLLATACFSRSSDKFYHMLLKNKWLGEYIRNYREGKGIPKRAKMSALLILWITIGYSLLFFVSTLWIKILLVLVAVAVTLHILSIKTLEIKEENQGDDHV